jgi:hypothetical protein
MVQVGDVNGWSHRSAAAPRATVVCTLGMHRSGTSLVSRVLNLLGVHLGPDARLLPARDDNPKGFWEHRRFVEINDAILEQFGGQWDSPPALPPLWPSDQRLAELAEEARHLLAEDFAGEPLWGWKDPRTCLTLPFWRDLIGPMRYVICVRNPCSVMSSLARRNGMSGPQAERLWLAHMQPILMQTSGQPRMFVFYEDIIEDWPRELRRMAPFIGHPERADDPRVHQAVRGFLERDLCHHISSMEGLASDERISFPTKSLCLAIRSHTNWLSGPVEDVIGLSRASQCAEEILDLLSATALEAWDRMAAAALECNDLARENAAQAATIGALDAERNRLASQTAALSEKVLAASVEGDQFAVRRVFSAMLRRLACRCRGSAPTLT